MSINFEKYITVEKNANESTINLPITERVNKILDMIEEPMYELLDNYHECDERYEAISKELKSLPYHVGEYEHIVKAKFDAAFNGINCKRGHYCYNTCDGDCKNARISIAFVDENGELQMVNRKYEGAY